MSLCADGSVEVYYDDYDRTTTFNEGQNVFVGVADVDCADPFVVTDNEAALEGNTLYQQITTGSAIRIVAPATSMVSQLSSPSGVVGVGESKEITVTAKAVEGMYAGELKNNLTMLTNDPTTPSVNIALTANITGDGLVPVAQLDATSVDFGEVFRTATEIRPVLLSNNGTNDLVVTSVTVEGGKFTVPDDVAKGFTIKPGYGKDIMITLPTETEGEVSDVLTVNYQDGTSAQVTLSGNVIGCPEISVTPESVTVDTPYGTDMAQTLTVNNGGNEALTFSVEPNAWFNITNLETDENSSLGYIYKSKTDYDEIEYNWIDITNDPETEHQDFTYYIDKTDYYTVEPALRVPVLRQEVQDDVHLQHRLRIVQPARGLQGIPRSAGYVPDHGDVLHQHHSSLLGQPLDGRLDDERNLLQGRGRPCNHLVHRLRQQHDARHGLPAHPQPRRQLQVPVPA